MVKNRLMLGVAFAALSLIPVTSTQALAEDVDLNITANWEQELEVEIEWTVEVEKEISIFGRVAIFGTVQADALAHATLKNDQVIEDNAVYFEDYQNSNSNSDEENLAEPGVGQGEADANFTEEGLPYPATEDNTVTGNFSASAVNGNIGINLSAGEYNMQENAAVIAAAEALPIVVDPSTGQALGGGGGAEAGSFSLQNLYNNIFNGNYFEEIGTGDATAPNAQSPEWENTIITNTVDIGGVLNASTGNIGLNAAAGAFNIQKNALVIATVTGGNLAEAVADNLQDIENNAIWKEDVTNTVTLGSSLSGSTGNIGVNLAAGVGNLQLNSLTIANALGGDATSPPPASPPPASPPPASPPPPAGPPPA